MYRVSLKWKICPPATIVAQQVQDQEGNFYFRHWNPHKVHLPEGYNTFADSKTEDCYDTFEDECGLLG